METSSLRVPLAVATGIIGLAVGALVMLLVMQGFGYHWEREPNVPNPFDKEGKGGGMMGGKGGGGGKAGGKGKGKGAPGEDKGEPKNGKGETKNGKGEPPADEKATKDAKDKGEPPAGDKKKESKD